MKRELPNNVHLQTLESPTETSSDTLLRLHHLYEKGADETYSKNAKVSFGELFEQLQLSNVKEKTMTGSLDKDKLKRQQWITDTSGNNINNKDNKDNNNNNRAVESVELHPVDIRTFTVEILPK